MIGTKCDKCGKYYKLKDTAAGKSINCECGNTVAVPSVPNLDENGERITPAKARQRAREEARAEGRDLDEEERREKAPVKEVKSIADRRDGFPDLSNKKICSKCKNIFNQEIKECPKCGFNTMGVKYDQTRKEEISRKVSQKIYHVGKYVIPATILIGMIIFFNMQMGTLEALKDFDKKVHQLITAEQNKMALDNKINPNADIIMHFYTVDEEEMPYFIAVPKKSDSSQFSFFGNGFFTLKRAGVCYEVKYNKGNRKEKRYYIEDKNENPLLINPREYNLYDYESIAFKMVGL